MKSIVLTSLSGRPAPDLRGETLYLRAGGSIMAFDGFNGALKWRKFVGFAKNLDPIRLEDGLGVLLNDATSLEVLRCDADTGNVAWRSQIGEPFNEPNADKDEIYVTTKAGRLLAIDADSGDAKWATQFPQELETAPGVDAKRQRLYLPGNHSNLYVINARDGSSVESLYIEHSEGTISVPPVPLFGHVFVIENAGSDYANIHILRVDEKGEKLRVAQDPIRLAGNVRVAPIIQGRRLIVLTDLGEVKVLDIEISAEGEQVSVAASLPPFYDHPTATQMAVGGSAMWITGTRVGRYELQIHVGQVVRDWSLHELDQCIGKPFISDDTLVYARVLRGTSAIRVTAAIPKTGEEIWKTDVGVPIAALRPAAGAVHVVTNQAVLYELDREAIASGSTKGPIENAGSRNVAARFTTPVDMVKGRIAFLDEGGGETILIYDPNREKEKLRQIPLRLTSGRPNGGMVFSGGGLFLTLTSGRAVLINWQTGAIKATPFQPASDPVGVVHWTTPVILPNDKDQVVVADDRKKIYRLRVSEQIRELASKDLEKAFLGPAASVQNTYVATMAGPAADFIVGHDLTSLEQTFQTLLSGRVTWGPVAIDDFVCIQTDDGNLRAFKSDGKEAFSFALPKGKPVGEFLKVEDNWVLAGSPGWFVTIDPSSGSIVGQDDLGQPISATPMSAGNANNLLLIPGAEGVIYLNQTPGN
jgi:outer membrane protein assembly factor BamB